MGRKGTYGYCRGTFPGSEDPIYGLPSGCTAGMTKPSKSFALACIGVLCALLAGCAAYRKCGFRGCPGDAAITARVEALFAQHPAIEPPNLLHVQTLDGVVYLTGIVDTDYQKQLATAVAREAGVTNVVNSIGLSIGR
jgi:BON domain